MDDLSLDHDSPHNGDDSKHAPKTPKRKQRKEKGINATNDAKKKDKEKKKPAKNSKQQKKDKKVKAKQKIPASSSSSALSQPKNRPTTIISGSTCVGLSTREFSHDQEGDDSSSSLSPSLPATRPLMASPSSYLGSRASRGSMPQFASSPELLDLSSVRSRPKSSIIAPAIPPPTPATTKLSPGKEKNAHSSSGFDSTAKATPSTSGAAKTRSRSGSSECVMEGFLEEALLKRSGSTHTRRVSKWRKRWVRLFRCDAGTFLLTHDKPPAAGKKPTSVRSRIDVLAMVTEKRDDIRRHAFVLMPDDCDRQPPSYFCAETDGARKSWITAITQVQRQEVSDIIQPLRSRQQEPGKEKEESELRPGMTSLDFDDLAENKRRKRTMVLVNGEEKREKREKVLDIQEEQDQPSDDDSEEARMMRDIERRVQELSAAQHQQQHHSGFGPSAPALSMSSVPAYYHPQQQLQIMQQHQHQQQQVLLRQQSYSVVGPHHPAPGSTLSGSYNPFVEVPSAAAVPQHHLQPQSSASYYMQPPVRRGSFVAADLSSSHSALPQAQTVVMSTLSAAAVSPSTSTSISSISPHGTPPAGLPSPHIPPPFMRQSSSIHMAAAHHNSHHHLLSSAPSAVAQS